MMKKQLQCFRHVTFSFFLVCTFFLLTNAVCQEMAQTTIVEVTGTETIRHEDDAANARERAISGCLVSAVEKVIADVLPVDARVANFKTLNDILFSYTDEIIQGYKVLTEDKYGTNYRIMVQATVSVNKVQQHLSLAGIVINRKDIPSVLFLVSEENLENIATLYWWGENMPYISTVSESALSETLQKKGFSVINHHQTGDDHPGLGRDYKSPILDIQGAIDIAREYKADVVIFGAASAKESSNTIGENIKSYIGQISLNAFRTDTETKIANIDYSAITVNEDAVSGGREALTKAGVKAGESLAPKILASWQKEEKKASKIKLSLKGTRYLSYFNEFRKNLSHIDGIKDVQTREIASDTATIFVKFQGEGQDLANALILNPFTSFGINIDEIKKDELKLEIIPVSASTR